MYILPGRRAKWSFLWAGATYLLIATLIFPTGPAHAQNNPTFKPGDQVLIAADRLNVFAKPDASSTVVTQVIVGWQTKFLKAEKDAQNNGWIYIGEGAFGWIPDSVEGKPSTILYTDKAIAKQIASAAALIKSKPKSIDGYVARATAYLSLNNYKASLADYDKAIQLLPEEGELYELRGKAELDSRDYAKASGDFLEAIRLGRKKPGTYNRLALAYQGVGESATELTMYKQALGMAPDWGLLYNNLADFYKRSNQYADALDTATQALQIDPLLVVTYEVRADVYLMQGQPDSFFKELDKAFAIDPRCADCYVSRGIYYANYLRDVQKAFAEFDKGVKAESNSAYALGNRGISYVQLGKLDAGIADLKRAAVLDSVLDFIPYNLGTAYGYSGQYKPALAAYNQAAALKGSFELTVYLYRPQIYIALGQYDEAEKDLAFYDMWTTGDTSREDFVALYNITDAILGLYSETYLTVAQSLQAAFDAYPDFVRNYTVTGRGYRVTPKREALISSLKNKVKAKPKDTVSLLQLGNLEMEFGYWDDALNTYRSLLKIKPDEDMDLMVTALADIFK